ncbi:ComEC family protein [Salmonella enterica subsp. enterica serovar Choleraesuis]|nr:ComEC family protein [Salmonella enterica subsp. enterica serovar Choleraesuis]
MTLRPIHAQLNEGGFDRQRYLMARHQILEGWVKEAQILDAQCGMRGALIARARELTPKWKWQAVMLALIFGERQQLSSEVRQIMRETGTAHLMAISGLHIAIAASIGIWLARGAQLMFSAQRINYVLPLAGGLLGATIYTWLAGAGPPTVRAMLAMGLWGAIRYSGRLWTTWQVWLCCVALLIASDPLIILSDSFRLSAIAVAGLIAWFQWAVQPSFCTQGRWRVITQLMWLQLGIELLILPAQIFLFHGVSLCAWLANLVAVPWISFITLPLLFMAVCLGHWLAAADLFWGLADGSLECIFRFLNMLPAGWMDIDKRFVWLTMLPWPLIMYWRLGLWRHYWAPGLGLLALACLPFLRQPQVNHWALHMLDVGHGLALVIERNNRALIYDTGNAWPGGSYARTTIIPWLEWHNLRPEWVFISHEHMDHRGGLPDIQTRWPGVEVYSSPGWSDYLSCYQGRRWSWQGLELEALWPPRDHKLSGNNRSCVLRVSDGHHSLLLTGDIEKEAEWRLVTEYGRRLKADILQVAHHGSRTSSTASFLSRVDADVGLASTARFNRWHLPAISVVRRFNHRGERWLDTAHEGQITVRFGSVRPQIMGLRTQILPRWYHQWFGDDPVSR